MAVNKDNKKCIKIAFTYFRMTAFVKRDLAILRKHFDVIPIQFKGIKDLFSMIKAVKQCNLTFSWFAWDHAAIAVFLSKIFKKKSIVVVGGMDAARVPEIGYGSFLGFKGKRMAIYACKHADMILPVSKFTKNEILRWVKPRNLKIIYNGVDIKKFKPQENIHKEDNLVITVGGVCWSNLKRKGIEPFVKSAKFLPEVRFVVIGKYLDDSIDYLKSIASSNVEFTGFVSDKELVGWYQKAKVICQLSYYEAFGLSPAEGMACGCIPVVTKERAGLPEFVGDAGFYVPFGDKKATADAIKKALASSKKLEKKSRERIEKMFPLKKRENELYKITADLTK